MVEDRNGCYLLRLRSISILSISFLFALCVAHMALLLRSLLATLFLSSLLFLFISLSLSSLLYHISLFFSFIIIYPFSFFIAETGRFNTLYHPSSL